MNFTRTCPHECFSLSIKSRILEIFSICKLWVSCSFITHFKIILSPVFLFALRIHIIDNSVSPGSSPWFHLFSHLSTPLLALCSERVSMCFLSLVHISSMTIFFLTQQMSCSVVGLPDKCRTAS